jgi:thioredoxin reductase (NADPH)
MDMENLSGLNEFLINEAAVLLYFYNDDCPPCISLRPKVETLINEKLPYMKLVWVDSKNFPAIPAHFHVFANPAILVFFKGKEYKRFSKYISTAEMHHSIKRVYKLLFEGD